MLFASPRIKGLTILIGGATTGLIVIGLEAVTTLAYAQHPPYYHLQSTIPRDHPLYRLNELSYTSDLRWNDFVRYRTDNILGYTDREAYEILKDVCELLPMLDDVKKDKTKYTGSDLESYYESMVSDAERRINWMVKDSIKEIGVQIFSSITYDGFKNRMKKQGFSQEQIGRLWNVYLGTGEITEDTILKIPHDQGK